MTGERVSEPGMGDGKMGMEGKCVVGCGGGVIGNVLLVL